MRLGFKIPSCTPCGCRLKNANGVRICTQTLILPDRTLVCKCGRRWQVSHDGVGGFQELERLRMRR